MLQYRLFQIVLLTLTITSTFMVTSAFAQNNATFLLHNGEEKTGRFLHMKNDTVYVEITLPDGHKSTRALHKSTFERITLFDWTIVDLSSSQYPDSNVKEAVTTADTAALPEYDSVDTPDQLTAKAEGKMVEPDSSADLNTQESNTDSGTTTQVESAVFDTVQEFQYSDTTQGYNDRTPEVEVETDSQNIEYTSDAVSSEPHAAESPNDGLLEEGVYRRKSVSVVPCGIGNKANSIGKFFPESGLNLRGYADYYIQKTVLGRRFDINQIPKGTAASVSNGVGKYFGPGKRLGRFKKKQRARLTTMVDNNLRAPIAEYVDKEKARRAQLLTNEQQNASFITDKAKSSAVAMEHIEEVFKSAYVGVPVLVQYGTTAKQTRVEIVTDKNGNTRSVSKTYYTFKLKASIAWFNIGLTEGSQTELVKIVTAEKRSTGTDIQEVVDKVFYKVFNTLAVKTRQIAYFQLTAQIENCGFLNASIQFRDTVDAFQNDKYYVVENVEKKDGTIRQRKVGYGYIYKQNESGKGYSIWRIAGKAASGMSVREKATHGKSLGFYFYRTSPELFSTSTAWDTYTDTTTEGNHYGVLLASLSPLTYFGGTFSVEAPLIRVPQFYISLAFEGGYADAEGTVAHGTDFYLVDEYGYNIPDAFGNDSIITIIKRENIDGLLSLNLLAGLYKRFYIRRVFLDAGIDGGISYNALSRSDTEPTWEDTVLAEQGVIDSSGTYPPLEGTIYSLSPLLRVKIGGGVSITSNLLLRAAVDIPINWFSGWTFYHSSKETNTYENSDGSTTVVTTEDESDTKLIDIPGNGFALKALQIHLNAIWEF